MPRKTEKNVKKDYSIYCIFSAETRQVFVGSITQGHTYQAYKDHARGAQALTKLLFEQTKKQLPYPSMYLLEEVHKTKREAYSDIVVWTAYFLQKGYHVLARQKTLDYATELHEENQLRFQQIKDLSIEEIINEQTLLHCRNTKFEPIVQADSDEKRSRITVLVSQTEHQIIKKKAQEAGLSMTQYCHQLIVNHGQPIGLGAIAQVSFFEYSEELKAVIRALRKLQLEIYVSGSYQPKDLELIEKKIEQVNRNYKNVVRHIERQVKKMQRSEVK